MSSDCLTEVHEDSLGESVASKRTLWAWPDRLSGVAKTSSRRMSNGQRSGLQGCGSVHSAWEAVHPFSSYEVRKLRSDKVWPRYAPELRRAMTEIHDDISMSRSRYVITLLIAGAFTAAAIFIFLNPFNAYLGFFAVVIVSALIAPTGSAPVSREMSSSF
jgi:hypothetical protein